MKIGDRSTGRGCGLAAATFQQLVLKGPQPGIWKARDEGEAEPAFGSERSELQKHEAANVLEASPGELRKWEAGRSVGLMLGPMLGRGLGGISPGADLGLGTC